jgi:hypothetical protein
MANDDTTEIPSIVIPTISCVFHHLGILLGCGTLALLVLAFSSNVDRPQTLKVNFSRQLIVFGMVCIVEAVA